MFKYKRIFQLNYSTFQRFKSFFFSSFSSSSSSNKNQNVKKLKYFPVSFHYVLVAPFAIITFFKLYNSIDVFMISSGPSMRPTLRYQGDIIIYHKKPREYRKDDIIVCKSKSDKNKKICKRIGGIAGSLVPKVTNLGIIYETVPNGHVWLIGDNYYNSYDSRHHGSVPITEIKGKAMFLIRFDQFPPVKKI